MDPDTDMERKEKDVMDKKRKRWKRPPSSYGSMRSDSGDMEEEEEEEEEEEKKEKEEEKEEEEKEEEKEEERAVEVAAALPEPTNYARTGLQLTRSEYPETVYTMATDQTKPAGAVVIATRSSEMGEFSGSCSGEKEDEDMWTVNSPEPPEPFEPMQTVENTELGRLHPEQDMPYIFRSIQNIVTDLNKPDLLQFKLRFYQWEQGVALQQALDGDILDFVDRMFELFGQDSSLLHSINTLENIGKKEEAEKLKNQCNKALIRYHLKQHVTRQHKVIYEGVVRAGRHNFLDAIYVEPQISTSGYGGVDPFHEYRANLPSPLQVPGAHTFVGVNDLFRLQKDDGTPVRTVLTTGLPGVGMSVSVGKFSRDWAELRANKDLQFVIEISFQTLWLLRSRNPSPLLTIKEVIDYLHPECKPFNYPEEKDCKFLIIMDSFDRYQATLDWENAPVINDFHVAAHPDVLIVNILRGCLLRGAYVWILGRRAAVSQIPAQFIDVTTEIQGFSDEMKDDYLTRRFTNAELARNIVTHYKRLPTLRMLARHPFICWMVATVFDWGFKDRGYGVRPPKLTPFYVNILVVQTNRRLQFYHGRRENDLKWSYEEKTLLINMGKMAFKMLERHAIVFFEEDVKECGLELREVTVFSGVCTELPTPILDGRRRFSFIHFTFQEFMAALYVFATFRTESKNILDFWPTPTPMPKIFTSKYQPKSAAGLVQCALMRVIHTPLGYYDMFLRFLCGLLCPYCHDIQLCANLFPHNAPKVGGLDEVRQLLEQAIQNAPEDRVENVKECLRELSQQHV
ncbi:NLR family CARD domain-containing protein 3 [Embiotoca jacksoni]|uniref:NLR family CARD domain-containing protein 3 n=1 Tax=Embiotoca jacksoni TaxID=100190 RepID=UPI003703AB90